MNSRPTPRNTLAILAALILVSPALPASEKGELDSNLEPLRPFLGRTWRGAFKDSTPDKPVIDIAVWERALNGKAVRIIHSINDGLYGGESIIHWDVARKTLAYHYFTTAGFHTTGTMTCADKTITAMEKVIGNTNGITEVRSTYHLQPDGTLLNKSEYLKGSVAAGGREVLYREAPAAIVKFK